VDDAETKTGKGMGDIKCFPDDEELHYILHNNFCQSEQHSTAHNSTK